MNHKRTTWAMLAASIFASTAILTNTQAQKADPGLDAFANALVKKGLLTEQEAKQALADAQNAQSKTAPYVFPWGKEAKLVLGGFLQAQGEFNNPEAWRGVFSLKPTTLNADANNPGGVFVRPTHDRFRLRRARLNVSGDFLENFDFKLEGDFAQSDGISGGRTAFSGTDLFLNWHQFSEANLKVGQYKAPFGLEQLTSDTTLYTAERSQVTEALTPERQIGVQLWGRPLARVFPNRKDILEYAVGIFNGNGRNTTINDDKNFMYAARVSSTLFSTKLFEQDFKWRIGVNGVSSQYALGTRIGPGGNLKMNLDTTQTRPLDGSLSGFTTTATNTETRAWGIDQTLTFGPFEIVAEYLEERIKPDLDPLVPHTSFNTFTANGYYAQGSYYFPGRKIQLMAKWESFNPGQDPQHHDNIQSITGGLNYYIKGDNLKLMLDYIHTWSQFRHENRSAIDVQAWGNKDQFDMILVRAQVMF